MEEASLVEGHFRTINLVLCGLLLRLELFTGEDYSADLVDATFLISTLRNDATSIILDCTATAVLLCFGRSIVSRLRNRSTARDYDSGSFRTSVVIFFIGPF